MTVIIQAHGRAAFYAMVFFDGLYITGSSECLLWDAADTTMGEMNKMKQSAIQLCLPDDAFP